MYPNRQPVPDVIRRPTCIALQALSNSPISSSSTNGALDLGCFSSLEKKFEASIACRERFSISLESCVLLLLVAYDHCIGEI